MFTDPTTYVVFFAGSFIYILLVYNMNLNIRLYSQLYVLPFQESISIFTNLLSGGIILGEFSSYST